MAAISSNVDVALANTRMLWSNTSSWVGGVVPTVLDDVTITGTKTTINQSNIAKWTGTITITVASTSGFPTVGYFYTYTNFSDYVKVNYTGTTVTTFTGCSIDYTDPLCNWKYSTVVQNLPTTYWGQGSTINNGYSVYAPTPVISIPAGYQANVSTMIVANGGNISMEPGSNLGANNWITVRDGRFTGRANVGNVSTIMVNRLEGNGVGYFQTENYVFSVLDVDGGETRSYGTINTNFLIGATNTTITMVNGSFAVGDEVAMYDTSYANTRISYYPYRDASADWRLLRDEGFDVAGVSGSQIWLARRNGARGKIKGVAQSGSQKVLTVDKDGFQNQVNFKDGDIVVINNKQYTIDSVKDSDYLLGSYNFQTGSTLSDFLTDYSATMAWSIDAFGAYPTVATATLVHKQFFRREIIVEAEISPMAQYTTGTRSTDQFGLIFQYDPIFRNGSRGHPDSFMAGYFDFRDSDGIVASIPKYGNPAFNNSWTNTALDTVTPTLKTIVQSPSTMRVELKNNFLRTYVNGEQMLEKWDNSGGMKGLAGVFATNGQNNIRVKSLLYRAPSQDLYITTADTFNLNDTVYEAGAEYNHLAGQRLLKIASKITNVGTHDDLNFSYRGGTVVNSNTWPFALNLNGSSTSSSLWQLTNHDLVGQLDYYVDLGSTANTNVTFDLSTTQTFTHVGFTPRVDDTTNAAGTFIKGIQILGSNDNVNFTLLYGPADDTKRYCNPSNESFYWYNQMGHYYTGPQTYRYVRFVTNGNNGSTNPLLNRWYKLGVYNFASNNYTIVVNNASDFANGDVINIMGHSLYTNFDDYHHYNAVKAGQNIDSYYWTPNTHSTIINVVGNTLYLDRPINYSFVEGGESVVKINRNFKMLGFLSSNGETKFQKPYFTTAQGTQLCRIHLLKNWQFYNVGSTRISGGQWLRGVNTGSQDYWNMPLFDGVSVTGYNNSDTNGLSAQNAQAIFRNCFVSNVRDFRPYYTNSRIGVAMYNNKATNLLRFQPESSQNRVSNYNEAAGMRNVGVSNVIDIDYFTSPVGLEYRRNCVHGVRDIPALDYSGRLGDTHGGGGSIAIFEYNQHYAMNYVAINHTSIPYHSWQV
jgi:hypothetical protein